jgi:hypothetical protein
VTVDLFDPIEFKGTVNKRQIGKGWGSSSFALQLLPSMWILLNPVELFSTDSFLMALGRFMSEREAFLNTIHQGNQLIAASKQLQVCYSDGVLEWAGRKGIE